MLSERDEVRYHEYLRQEVIESARTDLLSFTLFTKPDYRVNWHHRRLAAKLNAFVRGDIRFLMVFMPPRHGKSELVSRRLPAFIHGLYPDAEIFAASYLESLASEMTVATQEIMDSPAYKVLFPNTRLYPPNSPYYKGKRNSEEHHIVGRRGKYRGQGVGGSFTGKGMNFGLIDDPIKGREIADSLAFRERLKEFFDNDFKSRMETDLNTGRPGQILITLTRWHEDDLAGRLIEEQQKDPENAIKWDIVSYPAIRVDNDDKSDPREMGQALWPVKYSVEELAKFRTDKRAWGSLYQQDPRPVGGAQFKEVMFRTGPMPSKFDWTFITADTAFKDKQQNDFSVFSYWGVVAKELFWIDIWREQIMAADLEIPAATFIKRNSGYGFRGAYIEPKGHGIYLNQMLPRKPHGCLIPPMERVEEFFSDRKMDKVERANNAIPWLVGRFVTINEQIPAITRDVMEKEIFGFPRATHDDTVDTLVDAIKRVHGVRGNLCDYS
jgi:predicted phage terminase large subunit-like protein